MSNDLIHSEKESTHKTLCKCDKTATLTLMLWSVYTNPFELHILQGNEPRMGLPLEAYEEMLSGWEWSAVTMTRVSLRSTSCRALSTALSSATVSSRARTAEL